MRGQLEQKQVADTVMQPHKETRELLYRMLRAGYVQMQVRQGLILVVAVLAASTACTCHVRPYDLACVVSVCQYAAAQPVRSMPASSVLNFVWLARRYASPVALVM